MALLSTVSRDQSFAGKITGSNRKNFLSYPKELGTMERHKHYVMFFINKQENSQINFGSGAVGTGQQGAVDSSTEATTLQVKRAPTKRLSQAIALYMPAQISLQHQANYGEAEIGALVAGGMTALNSMSEGLSMTDAALKIGKEGLGNAGDALGLAALDALDATIAPGARAALEISRGKITNNRTEMQFEGVQRRDFSFSFKMLPTSPEEAQTIQDIVTLFRFHSMPEIEVSEGSDGRTMIPPSTFDIEYHPNKHLHRISTSILTSVDVKFGGERTQFFVDDQPVETELSLSFKELEIITKKRILDGF
jgi:hypothetical protein